MASRSNYIPYVHLHSIRETPAGVSGELHGEFFRLDVIRADVFRLKISRGGVFDETPTFAVSAEFSVSPTPFTVETFEDRTVVSTAALVATIGLDPFRVEVRRGDGTPIIQTAPAADGEGFATYSTLNDAFTFSRRRAPSDSFFGLGEKTGRANRSGRSFTLWNTDVLSPTAAGQFTQGLAAGNPRADNTSTEFDPYYMSIPFFHHRDAATGSISGSFVDNGYRASFDFSGRDSFEVHFSGGQYTEYVFAGPTMREVVEAYTWLTGRISLPPLWSLGYQQCRWGKDSQADVLALAERLRKESIPCDGLWLDIEYMDGYRVFTWDEGLFPDPTGMIDALRQDGFRLTTIVDPGVKAEPGYWVYDQAKERDVLCRTEAGDTYIGQVWPGNTAFPDFATEEARAWWGELNAAHVTSGVSGIWNDMNEPATGKISELGMRFDRGRASHERFHNQYALLMAMGTVQGLLKEHPNDRTFVLSRAGSPGIQRYAANWLGDNFANWDHLALSVHMATGLGVSGQPFVGADIGGFAGTSNPELFARWIQYGALTPFCRNHSVIGAGEQFPWSFGPAVLDIARDALQLRYRLLPYIYSAFVEASETGAPVQRPLVFEDQYDAMAVYVDDEYLFGPNLLVAPVLKQGATQRAVYLPKGQWYDWYTGRPLGGQRSYVADAPLDRILLYARAGAVIPMWPEAPQTTAGYRTTEVELHVFLPVIDGAFESFLQEDDGQTFAATGGARLRTRFVVMKEGDTVTLCAETSGHGFSECARERFIIIVHDGSETNRIPVDIPGSGFTVDLRNLRVLSGQ